jgi:5-methylcytosine-specific restriction endonuclease McrA
MTVRDKKWLFGVMKEVFLSTCVRCEGESGLVNLDRDHIIPRYQGGSDDPTNWQPLCAKCNASKGPERIDWRISFAKKHRIIIPKEWLL